MKRRRVILIIVSSILIGLFACYFARPKEPMYEGKPLSYWLVARIKLGRHPSVEQSLKGQEALGQAGTNAIPTLLRMLQERDSPLKLRLVGLMRKQRLIPIPFTPASHRYFAAIAGFHSLGQSASNAVPDLLVMYQRENFVPDQDSVKILQVVGTPAKDAVPLLIKWTTNQNFYVRAEAIRALTKIHSQPELTIPALIKLLESEDDSLKVAAAEGLGRFGSRASNAVPVLIPIITKYEQSIAGRVAAKALKAIDPEAAAKAGVPWYY